MKDRFIKFFFSVNIHGGKKESSMNTDTKNIKGSFRNQQKDYLPQVEIIYIFCIQD